VITINHIIIVQVQLFSRKPQWSVPDDFFVSIDYNGSQLFCCDVR